MKKPEKHILVIFGASGDLTYRKLIPSVYDLFNQNLLPKQFGILGLGRTALSHEEFRTKMESGIDEFANAPKNKEKKQAFIKKLFYYAFNTKEGGEYLGFKNELLELNRQLDTGNNFIFYLATPPSMYPIIPANLAKYGLHNENDGFKRLIVEKPFGYDLESARNLNHTLLTEFKEEQIYRIDH